MQQSYRRYQQKQYTSKRILTAAVVVGAFIGLIVILLLLTNACTGDKEKAGEVRYTEQARESAYLAAAAVRQMSEKLPEHIAPGLLAADQQHRYKSNKNRFSKNVMQELNEKITSEFVTLYDVTADEVIYAKNYTKKCYPASTTKLLTAITACKIVDDPQKVFTVGDEIKMIDPESSVAGLQEGQQLTFEMLIDALLLPSGNDAAYTIAVNCGRIYRNNPSLPAKEAIKAFMEAENLIAEQIGADSTHFVTPDGIHDDNHYTSAKDLTIIGDYARTIPLVKSSCAKAVAVWELPKGGTLYLQNSNKLLLESEGYYSKYADGMKTGFTDQAGTSVVASATINGHTLIAVVMNAQTLYTKYDDCVLLFTEGFKLYGLDYISYE